MQLLNTKRVSSSCGNNFSLANLKRLHRCFTNRRPVTINRFHLLKRTSIWKSQKTKYSQILNFYLEQSLKRYLVKWFPVPQYCDFRYVHTPQVQLNPALTRQ